MVEPTREEALQHLRSDYGNLRERLESLSEAEAVRPELAGNWSAKQLLSHVVAWEEEAVERLRLIAAGRGDEIRPIRRDEVDDWNAAAVERLSGVAWADLLARWLAVRANLVQAVEALSEEQFANPARRLRIARWLPDFAWAHEAEHAAELGHTSA